MTPAARSSQRRRDDDRGGLAGCRDPFDFDFAPGRDINLRLAGIDEHALATGLQDQGRSTRRGSTWRRRAAGPGARAPRRPAASSESLRPSSEHECPAAVRSQSAHTERLRATAPAGTHGSAGVPRHRGGRRCRASYRWRPVVRPGQSRALSERIGSRESKGSAVHSQQQAGSRSGPFKQACFRVRWGARRTGSAHVCQERPL